MASKKDKNLIHFDYKNAFSRNLGWLTPEELELLSTKVIAIPGLGGVGGHHLNNLLRLGIQNFHIADFDTFEIQNFNRQLGATYSSIGQKKTEVMAKFAREINPNCNLKVFKNGVTEDNQMDFLEGVDLVVDTLDIYAMDIRKSLYTLSHELKIPMVTAGPFGMGTTVMAFNPKGMSFTEYFDLKDPQLSTEECVVRFLAGIAPPLLFSKKSYLVYPDGLDINKRRLPSLNIGCDAATAALGTLVLKILLKREPINWAPRGFFVDFYTEVSRQFNRTKGNKGWLQKIKINTLRKKLQNLHL